MKLKEKRFLLHNKIYFFAAQVVRKKQHIFWVFVHGKKIIKKSNNTINQLYGLYKEVGKTQSYFSISIAWIGKHLTKKYNLSKLTTIKSNHLWYFRLSLLVQLLKGILNCHLLLLYLSNIRTSDLYLLLK